MTKESLKLQAISQTLFSPTSLKTAINKLGFVQADPIRAPARAQDLILRHRVNSYNIGDLEENYNKLNLEEDFLYAHGFMTREIWQLLHRRDDKQLSKFDKSVLEAVKDKDYIDPRDLLKAFGKKREVNWWGGHSNATKMALERLHAYGFLRIAGRQKGNRLYQYYEQPIAQLTKDERLEKLILAIVNILAPVHKKTLHQSLFRIRRFFGQTNPAISRLIKEGRLVHQKVDGMEYLSLPNLNINNNSYESVKFLAPFDPVVWDRLRFDHLWSWQYRFEAYTPKEKRIRGYYAMPLLWQENVIGWVNVVKNPFNVEVGFINGKPKDAKFKEELEKEIESIRVFLKS